MTVISPAITVKDPESYRAALEKVHKFADHIHVDISDNTFAPIDLLGPSQIWWPQEWTVDVHAMIAEPSKYVDQLIALKPHLIILHVEAQEDLLPIIQNIKLAGIKAGVALMRATVPADVAGYIEAADHVMIFSGDLGKYGGVASLMQLEKVRLIKSINAAVEIGWDGGASIENAFSLAQGGVDVIYVGGAIQKADDAQAAYDALVTEVNKQGVI